jgi:hypothetical protein
VNAPQYGYQPYQAAREDVAITSRFSPLAFMFATVKPKVFLNGYEMPVPGWGRTAFPPTPGQYHVHVHTPYFFPTRVGPADYTAVVNPGQFVELEYKAPLFTFVRGSLGPPSQSYKGIGATIAIIAVSVALVIAVAMLA